MIRFRKSSCDYRLGFVPREEAPMDRCYNPSTCECAPRAEFTEVGFSYHLKEKHGFSDDHALQAIKELQRKKEGVLTVSVLIKFST